MKVVNLTRAKEVSQEKKYADLVLAAFDRQDHEKKRAIVEQKNAVERAAKKAF